MTFTMSAVHAEASRPIILADNLSKVYAAGRIMVAAVREVSFEVKPGEFVAIVGPSGSGKSTLFYLLGGLTRASEGRVLIDGVDFATLTDAERTRLRQASDRVCLSEVQPAADALGYGQHRDCVRHQRPQGADGSDVPGTSDRTACRFGAGWSIGRRS